MNMPEKNHQMEEKTQSKKASFMERYKHYLTLEIEDYTPNDQKVINLFWMAFLLGYIKNKPVENILGIVVQDYFENSDLLPDKIVLEEVEKCRIYDDTVYRLEFFMVNGTSFINEYFVNQPVTITLSSDGSERIAAINKDSRRLIVYIQEDKMNELKNYLNNHNLSEPNRLRDALVRFYSFFHFNVPTVNFFIENNQKKIMIPDIQKLEHFIRLFETESGKMAYFWAKDLLHEGEAADFLKKHTGLCKVDAPSFSKFLTYIFHIKVEAIRELINPVTEKKHSREISLPLSLKSRNSKFAYGSCPGFSMNIFLNHRKNTFSGKKVKNKLKTQIKTFNPLIKQKSKHNKVMITNLFMNLKQYILKSGRFYLDFPVKMGDSLKNLYNQHVHIQQNALINELSEEILTKSVETSCGIMIGLSDPLLRLEFDYLLNGLTFQEILKNQKINIYMPYRIQMDINKNNKIISSGIFKLNLRLVVHEALLNKPIVHFLYPENIHLCADIDVSDDDANEEYASFNMHLILKPYNIQNTTKFFDDFEDFEEN